VAGLSELTEGLGEPAPKSKHDRSKLVGWLALVLPAVLAGVFSLIPNVFERITSPEASLSYSLISSPSIRTTTGYSRILSLTIENSGTTRITGVEASITFAGGTIERMSVGDSSGDRPQIGTAEETGRITVRSLFPKERIAVTALATSLSPATRPSISVRSEQTLGLPKATKDEDRDDNSPKWTAILAALGALTATGLGLFTLRNQRGNISSEYFHMMNARADIPDRVVDTSEAIMFIADLVGSPQLTERLEARKYKMLYVQFADILAASAELGKGEQRRRMIAGLKSILMLPFLHDTSKTIIEDYLTKLGVGQPFILFVGDDVKDRLTFRKSVRQTFVAEGVSVAFSDTPMKGPLKRLFTKLSR